MDQAARERIEGEVTDAASQRFPGAVHGVVVLQRAIGRSVRPGEITIRVLIRPDLPGGRQRQLRDFEERHRPEIEQFQRDLSQQFPRARRLEFTHPDSGRSRIKPIEAIIVLLDRTPGQPGKESTAASDLTPVMARLGPTELEIVDTPGGMSEPGGSVGGCSSRSIPPCVPGSKAASRPGRPSRRPWGGRRSPRAATR
jgi:hypothetical protein